MVTTAVDKWPAYAGLSAVAPAGHLPTAPTPRPGTRPTAPGPERKEAKRAELVRLAAHSLCLARRRRSGRAR